MSPPIPNMIVDSASSSFCDTQPILKFLDKIKTLIQQPINAQNQDAVLASFYDEVQAMRLTVQETNPLAENKASAMFFSAMLLISEEMLSLKRESLWTEDVWRSLSASVERMSEAAKGLGVEQRTHNTKAVNNEVTDGLQLNAPFVEEVGNETFISVAQDNRALRGVQINSLAVGNLKDFLNTFQPK